MPGGSPATMVLFPALLSLLAVQAAAVVRAGPADVAHAGPVYRADVVVYGATAAGCMAAIAASRTGAQRVVVATPYKHVGGMTTGGIMHADSANTSTIKGLTLEFFTRVLSHYPTPPPSPPPSPSPHDFHYECRADRCLQVSGRGTSSDPTCGGTCPQLAANEWLAVTFLSALSDGNRTLTVSLPAGQNSSFLKKSELLERFLHPGQYANVTQGQVLRLASPAAQVDPTYYLITLPSVLQPLRQTAPSRRDAPAVAPGTLHPGSPGQIGPAWLYESHVAEEVLEAMMAEANVTVVRGLIGLAAANVSGNVLRAVTSESGATLMGDVWVDGSYEGDLAFAAGADTVYGRESRAEFNETGAGVQPPSLRYDIDPFWPDGSVIPHVSDEAMAPVGHADNRTEVYDFRLCFTNSPGHRIPVSRPEGYNASEWELWRRIYAGKPPQSLRDAGLSCLGPIPNNYTDCVGPCIKCDMLGMVHGTDMLNGAWGYPNGTTAEREVIRQAHINYTLGLLWFWATDNSTGEGLHQEMRQVGHCSDEYDAETTPPHWPYQLYVREARRLRGDFVWTEHDPPAAMLARSVGLGAYSFDSHWVSLYVDRSGARPIVSAEGRVNNGHDGSKGHGVYQRPYQVPYDALLPKRQQVSNLLVPVAVSSTHIRMNAVRMEPAWMIQGHAAGTAAAMALANGSAVQDLDVPALQRTLVSQGQMLWP